MKNVRENEVEAYLRRQVEKLGGLCLKIPADYMRGVPDRIVLLPHLREVFSVLIMEGVHEIHHRLAGFARDTECKVGFRLLLQQGEDNRLLTRSLADHGIDENTAAVVRLFLTSRQVEQQGYRSLLPDSGFWA